MHTIHERHKDYKWDSCCKSFSRVGNLKKIFQTVHEGTMIKNVNFVAQRLQL